jgi:chemotaxis protein CheX
MMQASDQSAPFQFEFNEKYVLIRLKGRPNIESAKLFEQESVKQLEGKTLPVILNCKELEELNTQWLRALAMFSQQLKSAHHQFRLIEVKPEIAQIIRQNALAQALPIKPNLHIALVEFGIVPARKIDVNFINPFLVATIGVLKIQANVIAKPGQPFKCGPKDRYFGDVSGVIGLVSEAFVGAVVLSFPEKTFLAIMSSMLGEPLQQLSQEIVDGAGELTNIIFGQAKLVLNEQGYGIKTAIPTVVTGSNHTIQTQASGPRVALPFESTAGPFTVEICLSE